MNKSKKEEIAKKKLLSRYTCYDWLINNIPDPINRQWDRVREQMGVFLQESFTHTTP